MQNIDSPNRTLSGRAYTLLWLLLSLLLLIVFVQWNESLRRAAIRLIPLAEALLFLLTTTGLGYSGSRILVAKEEVWIQILTSTGIGLGLNAIFVFVCGMIGIFSQTLFLLWMAAGLILFVIAAARWRRLDQGFSTGSITISDSVALGIIGLILVPAIPYVVCPETSTDALTYHLLAPKIYLSAGKISFLPLLVESNYPSLAEYNYLMMLSFTNEIVCKSFHFLLGLILVLLLARFVKKLNVDTGIFWPGALFVSMPVVVAQLGWAWNDFFYSLFILLCLYFLLSYQMETPEERSNKHLLAAGIMAGLAAWTKYTFVLFVPVLFLIVLIGIKKWQWKEKSLLWLFVPIGLLSLPWVLKNWSFTGNPFYPFLNSIFLSPYWSDASNAYFKNTIQNYYIQDWHWYTYLLFPFLLILKGRLADIQTGILPLLLLPFLFVRRNVEIGKDDGRSLIQVYLIGTAVVWWLLRSGIRTVFPLLAILFVLSAVKLQQQWKDLRMKPTITFLAALILFTNVTLIRVNTDYLSDPYRFFIGLERDSDYLKRMSPSYNSYDYLNSQSKVRKVLLVSLHDPLYLKYPCYFSGRHDTPIIVALSYDVKSSFELASKLKRLGISHVALHLKKYQDENASGLYTWSPQQKQIFESMLTTEGKAVARFASEVIVEWK
jgi:Dolichyl-phosphate-mannose-protein mannosyltransferase